MPIETTTKYDMVQTFSEYTYPLCTPPRSSYTRSVVGLVQRSYLDPQHRVKPLNLWGQVTALPRQYTTVEIRGRSQKTDEADFICGANGHKYTRYRTTIRVGAGRPYLPDAPVPSWALDMRNKIQDDKVSFAETIGELLQYVEVHEDGVHILRRARRRAIELLKTRGNRRKLLRWFRRTFGRRPNSKFELMDVVSTDLAIKFGIIPNCQLLYDGLQALDKLALAKRRIIVTKRRDTKIQHPDIPAVEIDRHVSVRAICYVTFDVDDSQFTAGNIAESIWAGIPLSFVVDWFWNLNSWLSSFNAMNGVKELVGVECIRRLDKYTDRRVNEGYTLKSPGIFTMRSYERKTFSRLPYAFPPGVGIPDSGLWERLHSLNEILVSIRRPN